MQSTFHAQFLCDGRASRTALSKRPRSSQKHAEAVVEVFEMALEPLEVLWRHLGAILDLPMRILAIQTSAGAYF